jgi:1,4-alpha-glucan branching enzyme
MTSLDVSGNTLGATPPSKIDGKVVEHDGTGVIQMDPWLEPYRDQLKHRYSKAYEWIRKINENEGGLDQFSKVPVAIDS